MLNNALKRLAEMEPEKYRIDETDVAILFLVLGLKPHQEVWLFKDGTSDGLTQDWFDARLLEAFGRECETTRTEGGWQTHSWLSKENITFGEFRQNIVEGKVESTKLLAVQSCFEAVVNSEWEKREKK